MEKHLLVIKFRIIGNHLSRKHSEFKKRARASTLLNAASDVVNLISIFFFFACLQSKTAINKNEQTPIK